MLISGNPKMHAGAEILCWLLLAVAYTWMLILSMLLKSARRLRLSPGLARYAEEWCRNQLSLLCKEENVLQRPKGTFSFLFTAVLKAGLWSGGYRMFNTAAVLC